MTATFDNLPDEMACAILQWLPPRWLWLASFVSHRWRQCAAAVGPRVFGTRTDRTRSALRTGRLFNNTRHTRTIGDSLMNEAAGKGLTSVVLWLYHCLGIPWTSHTVRETVLGGHKHTLDCMSMQRFLHLPVDKSCLLAALIGSRGVQLAHVIHKAGQPWSAKAMAIAVALGDKRTVSALHRAGCPHDDLAIALAIVCGRRGLLDAMEADDGDVGRVATALRRSPCSGRLRVSMRYATVVCDTIVLGLSGRKLAKAILAARTRDPMGIRNCPHHQPPMRAVISADIPLDDLGVPIGITWGTRAWSLFESTMLATSQSCGLAKQATFTATCAVSSPGASPAVHLGPTDARHLSDQRDLQQRIAKRMRDHESRARRCGLPPPARRSREPHRCGRRARHR